MQFLVTLTNLDVGFPETFENEPIRPVQIPDEDPEGQWSEESRKSEQAESQSREEPHDFQDEEGEDRPNHDFPQE